MFTGTTDRLRMVRTESDSVFLSLCILSSSPHKSAVALVLGRTDSLFFFFFFCFFCFVFFSLFFWGQFFNLFMHGSFALTSRDLQWPVGGVKDDRVFFVLFSPPRLLLPSSSSLSSHSSGAVWESRWPSWAVRPNEPYGFRGRKTILNHASALVTACP